MCIDRRAMNLLKDAVRDVKAECDRAQIQLAGCSAASLGYADDCKQGDYGWSPALQDVKELRKNYTALLAKTQGAG